MKRTASCIAAAMSIAGGLMASTALVHAQDQAKPNILFIMGDDVGWFNIGAYHRGHHVGQDARTSTSWRRRA